MTAAIDKLKDALSGRYTIERQIGSGGMAYVYLAEDLKHRRKVALKLLRPELRRVVEGRRFLEEIHVTAKLNHPNILPLFDSGEVDGMLYYVMPYVDGETLSERLEREGQLPIGDALFIASEIANALEFAHSNGVIHRDVKPGNILLQAGLPLIGDFGIALAVADEPSQRVTDQGLLVGTPEYMSPEQAHADPQLDARGDVYSLGSVLYEMIAGEPPFVGKDPYSVLTKVIKEKPRSLREKREDVPPEVDAAVLKTLAKEADLRFASAAEFAAALKSNMISSHPSLALTGAPPTDRRRKLRLLGTALAAVLTLTVGMALVLPSDGRVFTAGQTQRLTNAPGLELDPAASPDGDMVAFSSGSLGSMKIYLQQADAGSSVIGLTDSIPGHHRWPRWSPDGTQLAFLNWDSGGSAVQIMTVPNGEPRTVVRIPSDEGEVFGASWSPDGKQIAYGRNGGIYLAPVDGGAPRRLVEMVDGHSPQWSPDGSRIVFVSGNPTFVYGTFVLGNIAPSALWIVTVNDGVAMRLTETTFLHMSPVWTKDGKSLVFVSNHDGRRDIYQVPVDRDGRASGERVRLTTGLNVHTVSLAGDDSFVAYSALHMDGNVWSLDIPAQGVASAALARPVTHGNQMIEGLSVSPDGEWLAYDSDQHGTQDIYRLYIDGGEPERLTTDPHDDFHPAWTQDGSTLAFYSFRTGKRDVWVMDADGNNETRVTHGAGHNRAPRWSPDGNSIVYHSDMTGRSQVFIVSRENEPDKWSEPRQLTTDGGANAHWSPDGREIAYVESGTVRVVSVAGGDPRVLTTPQTDPDGPVPWTVAWSPRGDFIYFKAFGAGRHASFWSVPATGSTPRILAKFDDPRFQSRRTEFGTDGKRLFFTVGSHESDIWKMDLRDNGDAREVPGPGG